MENDRSVLFETCRLRPVGQTFSFSHVIVNDMRRTSNGGRRLEISEFAVFGGHNAIVGNKSVQTLPSHGTPWTPIDTSGPILFRLDDNRVRIVRGRPSPSAGSRSPPIMLLMSSRSSRAFSPGGQEDLRADGYPS